MVSEESAVLASGVKTSEHPGENEHKHENEQLS